ncbi:hypothetical protein ACIOEX_11105 [Streptomyces sp. NPDC087850]|uniref:hypothetical protein n=1 Tax=Streptomyces sp. NPDC087850 TaxID=3365809 RepID=UPI00381F810D
MSDLPQRIPAACPSSLPYATCTATRVTITDTRQIAIDDPGLLMLAAWRIARADPQHAAALGYAEPWLSMTEAQALTLLLADMDASDLAERGPLIGIRVIATSTLATRTSDDATIYEDETVLDGD